MKYPRINDEGNIICEICEQTLKYKKGLSKHLSYTHKYNLKKYYNQYLKEDNEDLCKVCKKETDFRSFRDGYKKLCKNCINKSKFPCNIEYWIYHGYTIDESIKKVSIFQSTQSKKVHNRISNTNIGYWLKKGYSDEEAKQKLKERQATGSLENFIKRYGKKEGKIKWKERQIKWQNTLNSKSPEEKKRINKSKGITLKNMIRKWGEVEGTRRYYQWLDKTHYNIKNNILFYSKVSQELFNILLDNIEDKDNVKFATHKKEKIIKGNDFIYFYDFCYKNKIIEFNGDMWHANPRLFKKNDKPNPHNNLSSKEIWNYDNKKINEAKKEGYKILIIWESDFKNNKKEIISKCIKFINE
jgi:hypothetical protein